MDSVSINTERISLTTGILRDELIDLILNHGVHKGIIKDVFNLSRDQIERLTNHEKDLSNRREQIEYFTAVLRCSEAIRSGILPEDFGLRTAHIGRLTSDLFRLLQRIYVDDSIRSRVLSKTFNVSSGYLKNNMAKSRIFEIRRLKETFDAVAKKVLMVRKGLLLDDEGIMKISRYELADWISKRAAFISNEQENF